MFGASGDQKKVFVDQELELYAIMSIYMGAGY